MSLKEKFLLNRTLQKQLENILLYTFLTTIFLGVVTFIPSSSVPFLYTKVSLFAFGGAVVFVVYAIIHLLRGSITLPRLLTVGILWLVPIAYVLSALFSNTSASVTVFGNVLESDTLIFILLAAFFGTLGAILIRNVKQYKLLYRAGIVLAGAIVVFQIILLIISVFTKTYINSNVSVVGSFYDIGILSGFAVIAILFMYRFMDTTLRTKKILRVVLLIMLFFIAISNSTTTWFLVAIIATGLLIERIVQRKSFEENKKDKIVNDIFSMPIEEVKKNVTSNSKKARLIAPTIVLVTSLVFVVGGSSIISGVWSVNSVRPSFQSTMSVGSQVYSQSYLFGSGPNTFGQDWLNFRDSRLNTTQFWNTDFVNGVGFIPTSFVTTGIIGIIAWISFLAFFVFFGIRALIFRRTNDEEINTIALVIFIGAIYFLTEFIFVVPGPAVIIFGFVIVGVFMSVLKYFEPQKEKVILFSRDTRNGLIAMIIIIATIIISIRIAYFVVENYIARVEMLQAQNALRVGDLQNADISINRSLSIAQTDSAYRTKVAIGIAYIQKIEKDTKNPTKETRNKLQTALTQTIAAGNAAIQFNPNSYDNWYALGDVYKSVVSVGAPGAYKAAVGSYKKAQKLNPTSPIMPFALAQVSVSNKLYKKAEDFLNDAISLKKDYAPAFLLYSQVEAQLGKTKNALQAAESAVSFAPNNPVVLFQVGVLKQNLGDFIGAIESLSKSVNISPKYANARYFLAIAYAHNKEYKKALTQLKSIASMSSSNAKSVEEYISVLKNGKNPFATNQKNPLSKKITEVVSGK